MRKNRIVSRFIAGTLAVSLSCFSLTALAASDLDGHWAQEVMTKWIDAGKIQGYEDGTIRPDAQVTRAEFAVIVANVLPKAENEDLPLPYTDVSADAWYTDSIQELYNAGAVLDSELFRPDEPITRQDAMEMAGKAFFVTGYDLSVLEGFSDFSEISEEAQHYVAGFVANGYITGYEDNTLRPNAPITRAESIQMLDKLDIVHEKNSLKGIMDRIYEGVETAMPRTIYQEITDENAEYFLGLKNLDAIDEALASDAAMRPVAHSVCLARVKDGEDVEAVMEEIRTSVNPMKWICVGVNPENIQVVNQGNLILLVMTNTAPQEIVDSFLALELE